MIQQPWQQRLSRIVGRGRVGSPFALELDKGVRRERGRGGHRQGSEEVRDPTSSELPVAGRWPHRENKKVKDAVEGGEEKQ